MHRYTHEPGTLSIPSPLREMETEAVLPVRTLLVRRFLAGIVFMLRQRPEDGVGQGGESPPAPAAVVIAGGDTPHDGEPALGLPAIPAPPVPDGRITLRAGGLLVAAALLHTAKIYTVLSGLLTDIPSNDPPLW